MTPFGRFLRQFFTGAAVFILIAGAFYGSYKRFFPTLPDCFDGIKNQDELGIDCGGTCENKCPLGPRPDDAKEIQVEWAKYVQSEVNAYDLAAKVINQNKYWGLEKYNYEFKIKDKNGVEILSAKGSSYLLPNSYDYVVVSSQEIKGEPGEIELVLSEEKWASVNETYGIASLAFQINNKTYLPRDINGFPAVTGYLVNGTTYDFSRIDIKAALYGENENLLAISALNVDSMMAREERYFSSILGATPAEKIANMDFLAIANIFDSENFMRRYGVEDKNKPYR